MEEKSSVVVFDEGLADEEQFNEDDQGKTMPDDCQIQRLLAPMFGHCRLDHMR